jgi:hypothetical protein
MAYEERNNSINPISIEKDLIVRFSEGKYPTGKDFKALIEYINGVTIDLSQINEPIYLGDRLVQKYNLINIEENAKDIFLYDKDKVYCMHCKFYSETGLEEFSYKVCNGNYYFLEGENFKREAISVNEARYVVWQGLTEGEVIKIKINKKDNVCFRLFIVFILIK